MHYALENQKDVQNAKLDAEISKAQVKEILGIGLPQLNSSFDIKDYEELPTSLIPGEFFGGDRRNFHSLKVRDKMECNSIAYRLHN